MSMGIFHIWISICAISYANVHIFTFCLTLLLGFDGYQCVFIGDKVFKMEVVKAQLGWHSYVALSFFSHAGVCGHMFHWYVCTGLSKFCQER